MSVVMIANPIEVLGQSYQGYEQTDGGRRKVTFAIGCSARYARALALVKGHISEDDFKDRRFFTVRVIGRNQEIVDSTTARYLLWPCMDDPYRTLLDITPRTLKVVDFKEKIGS